MPGPSTSLEAFVLGLQPPAESHARLSLFSVELGAFTAFQRITKKVNSPAPPVDLFDRVTFVLDAAPQGDAWFVREARISERQLALARDYEALRLASALAQAVTRNPVPAESRARVFGLLQQAFASFGQHGRADVTYFKSLFAFIRDEGYPLRQQWMASLSRADQEKVSQLLRNPVEAVTLSRPEVLNLLRRFETYLRAETEFFVPATEGP